MCCVCVCVCVCVCFSYQQTVEKDMDEHAQGADDEVHEMVEELKVQHHGFVAACEGSSIPHETYQEDDFVTHLEEKSKSWFNKNNPS